MLVPVAALLALVVAAACDAESAGAPSARPGLSATCRLSRSMMVGTWRPDLISMFRDAPTQLPGSQGTPGHPPWDITQYVCGQYEGFVANIIMYGKYRAEDNALARSLGYRTGKLPLLPVVGQVVSAVPHGLFEAYEEAFQFRTEGAAATWLADARWEPVPPKNMTGVSLPADFIARAGISGPNDGKHEHGIGISGQIGATVLVVSFHGGRELSWSDVGALWTMAYDHFRASGIDT